MKEFEYDLTVAAEELGEVIVEALAAQKVITKALRFGLSDEYYAEGRSKAEKLREELIDVMICARILAESGVIDFISSADVSEARQAKQAKIERTKDEARRNGCLT